ncbi:MAG: hypothetical protein GON13_01510 [Nanoarchaeota archaeon]|nr:hypothetical protein [Nanoarchaeota archaeon]
MVKGVGSKIKWKRKKWFNILAPSFLGETQVGQTPAIESSQIKGRKVKVNVSEIINDPRKQDKILTLKINKISGNNANTYVKSFSTNKSLIRRIVRKGGSRIDINDSYETKDKNKVNIKTLLFTSTKCPASKKKDIRVSANEHLTKIVNTQSYDDFVLNTLHSKNQIQIKKQLKQIQPIRTIEIIGFTNLTE